MKKNTFRLTVIAAIAAASVLGCNPPTNPPPTPVQPKTPLKLVYGTDNTIQAVRNKALDSARPTLTPEGTTAKYSISDAPAWLTVNADTGVLSAAADETRTLTKGDTFTAAVTAAGVGGAYDKETAEAKISINVVDELTITFNPPAGTTLPGAGEPHVTGTKNTSMEFGGTFTVNPPDPSVTYELDPASDPLPPGLTIDPKTGKITGTPTAPTKGPINIIIRAKDTTAKITLRLQINPDEFPAGMSYAATTIARGSSASVALTGAEGVTASYAFESDPLADARWLTINPNTGAISVGNAAAPVRDDAPFGTTPYKIKVTGTGQYADIPPETLDFSLTVQAAMFPDPLGISYAGLILKKGGTNDERSGNASVTDSNDPKLTVEYTYADANTVSRPSWLDINLTTGAIDANNAANSDLPNVGATKTYKIRVTGTGIYEGRTADIDFVISGSALPIPDTMVYPAANQVEKGKSKTVDLTDRISGTYEFDATSPTKPAWLSIDSSTGRISIATVPEDAHGPTGGEVTYRIKVEGSGNYQGQDKVLNFKLNVKPAPIPTNMSYGATKVVPIGSAVGASLTNGIDADYAVLSVTRPGGATSGEPTLAFGTNGAITGPTEVPTTTVPGTYTYTIRVTGKAGTIHQGADSKNVTFTLRVPTPIPTNMSYSPASIALVSTVTATLTNGIDANYAQQTPVAVTGGATASNAPRLTFGDNGAITGPAIAASTPTGTYTYTIRVTGKAGTIYAGAAPVDVQFALTVTPAAIPSSTMSYTSKTIPRGTAVTASFTSSIDAANFAYRKKSVTRAGAAASGEPALTSGTNGDITGPAIPGGTPLGVYTYTIEVTGKAGTIYAGADPVDVTFALTVIPAVIPNVSYSPSNIVKGSGGLSRIVLGAPSSGLTYAIAATPTPPPWLSINSSTGRITFGSSDNTVPADAVSSSITVNVSAVTGSIYEGASPKTATFAFTVRAANIPVDMKYGDQFIPQDTPAQDIPLEGGIDATYTQLSVDVSGGADAGAAPALTFGANGAITNLAIADTIPTGTYRYTIRVTPKDGTIYAGTGASSKNRTFRLIVTQQLPLASLTSTTEGIYYESKSASKHHPGGLPISKPLYRRISISPGTVLSDITADQASFSVVNTPLTAPTLTVNNVGRVSTRVDLSSTNGTYVYTIRITGKGIYRGSTRDVTFQLEITG